MVALDICDEGLVTSLKLVAPIYNIYMYLRYRERWIAKGVGVSTAGGGIMVCIMVWFT